MKCDYIFESDRLGFRRWKDTDKEVFSSMNADDSVMAFFPGKLTKAQSDSLIDKMEEHLEAKGYGLWAVELKKDGSFIGFIGLSEVNLEVEFKGAIEIGWRLDKKYWKKGYAREGAEACLAYAFETLKMKEIHSFTSALNLPSEMVMKRIGMTKIGEFEHPLLAEHHPLRKHVLYKITSSTYHSK
ncbi:GNAT family N-acetyltransferase [Planococcus salinus]|uniref:N-acetyltransferase n=1 Tax=Planococcus salinus TaxID=1848460 RepID=A0A3M8P706_9BACL|nr:GNAT family N-acetyltransferase [Planococcus salinus]RNF38974.1 N-acetyltransferase [Planococcus salinus]